MKSKLTLKEIEVSSFITEMDNKSENTIQGQQNNIDKSLPDTSKINNCTPHGTIQTCPTQYNCTYDSWDLCRTNEVLCKIGSLLFQCK